jgi:hypothetical protein
MQRSQPAVVLHHLIAAFLWPQCRILATTGSKINISDSTVTTIGDGANGIFATGDGSAITISNVKIDCTGNMRMR